MRISFGDFIDKKTRDAKKQLRIVKEMLHKSGMKVVDHTDIDDDDPYVYLYNPKSEAAFKGVRIYKIGEKIAFRIQREEKTFPFGKAYALPIPDMFEDLVSDNVQQEAAGKKIIEQVAKEMKRFFDDSLKAERDVQSGEINGGLAPTILIQSTGTDYASSMSP